MLLPKIAKVLFGKKHLQILGAFLQSVATAWTLNINCTDLLQYLIGQEGIKLAAVYTWN